MQLLGLNIWNRSHSRNKLQALCVFTVKNVVPQRHKREPNKAMVLFTHPCSLVTVPQPLLHVAPQASCLSGRHSSPPNILRGAPYSDLCSILTASEEDEPQWELM